ncbi:uncharacterized protein [Montipora capricornis]|uniref:uncharacterized protein n=1 Tax=Montipora capricornis TaxID=246305 RepID=UPI0035F1D25F
MENEPLMLPPMSKRAHALRPKLVRTPFAVLGKNLTVLSSLRSDGLHSGNIRNDKKFQKKEMELKKKEQENKAAQHQILIDQQIQNQQQYQDVMKMMAEQQQRQEQQLQNFKMLFLQQEQQQSQMLMSLLEKVMRKSS